VRESPTMHEFEKRALLRRQPVKFPPEYLYSAPDKVTSASNLRLPNRMNFA
jgi:hypothetical protein